jgi:ABC-2 type transport system permease protein
MRLPESLGRIVAMLLKELIQMRRDRLTFGMIVGIPIIQLLLFGYAINTDPKHLPTMVQLRDPGPEARSLLAALRNSAYFDLVGVVGSEAETEQAIAAGRALFVVTIPEDFSRKLLRGERALVLVEADGSDPLAVSTAVSALDQLDTTALRHDLVGSMEWTAAPPAPLEIRLHRRYNPEGITAYNIVPGLLGVILTMTMVLMTALAVTREQERGTMENLLAMPVRPFEVMIGKILPYMLVGWIQVAVVLAAATLLFGVPMLGSFWLLAGALLLYILANLTVGFTFSTLARNQLQAMQMTFFFFLPSILLSGFMFPFRGMPQWAQAIGEVLPLTHFLRIVRGIMLKGTGPAEIWPDVWPLLLFLLAAGAFAMVRYRRTLD